MTEKVRPLHDRIAVRRDDAQETTPGGVYLPNPAQDVPRKGTVVAVGEGRRMQDGTLLPPSVNVGDRVIFGRYAGSEIEVDGDKLSIMRETDLAAVIVDEAAAVEAGSSSPPRISKHEFY